MSKCVALVSFSLCHSTTVRHGYLCLLGLGMNEFFCSQELNSDDAKILKYKDCETKFLVFCRILPCHIRI